MKILTATFSKFVAFLVASKLDLKTSRDWEHSQTSLSDYPTYSELQKFLKVRTLSVEDRNSLPKWKSEEKKSEAKKSFESSTEKKSYSGAASKANCIVFNECHYLHLCEVFLSKSAEDRFEIVKKNRPYLKCFNSGHQVVNFKRNNCSKCDGRHSTFLHSDIALSTTKSTKHTASVDTTESNTSSKLI